MVRDVPYPDPQDGAKVLDAPGGATPAPPISDSDPLWQRFLARLRRFGFETSGQPTR